MSILSGLAGPTNGVPEPDNVKDAESVLTGDPLTLGYRPSLPVTTFWDRGGSYVTTMLPDVEGMILHPHIYMPYSYYKSGIATAEFEVKANSTALQKDAESWINRFWERALDPLQHSYDYGWNGYEVCYTWEDGKLVFDCLQDFFPLDAWIMTEDRRYRGVSVQGVQGAKEIEVASPDKTSRKVPVRGRRAAVAADRPGGGRRDLPTALRAAGQGLLVCPQSALPPLVRPLAALRRMEAVATPGFP